MVTGVDKRFKYEGLRFPAGSALSVLEFTFVTEEELEPDMKTSAVIDSVPKTLERNAEVPLVAKDSSHISSKAPAIVAANGTDERLDGPADSNKALESAIPASAVTETAEPHAVERLT